MHIQAERAQHTRLHWERDRVKPELNHVREHAPIDAGYQPVRDRIQDHGVSARPRVFAGSHKFTRAGGTVNECIQSGVGLHSLGMGSCRAVSGLHPVVLPCPCSWDPSPSHSILPDVPCCQPSLQFMMTLEFPV